MLKINFKIIIITTLKDVKRKKLSSPFPGHHLFNYLKY